MQQRKDKIKAVTGAALFHLILLLALIFLGLSTPLPLPEEEGVEVNLGFSDLGKGSYQSQTPQQEVRPPAPSQQQESSNSDKEELVEDITSEAPNIQQERAEKPKKEEEPQKELKEEKEAIEDKTEETVEETPKEIEPEPDPEPVVDPRLLYTGKNTEQGESAQGNDEQAGDKGQETGDPNDINYEGLGGQGNGISYNLGNRIAKSLPKPQYNSDDQGKVVVSIWVNKLGEVTRAEIQQKGTNVSDISLRKMAQKAALNAKFTADTDAAEIQKGSITYHFIKLN
jgi:TonB family protein